MSQGRPINEDITEDNWRMILQRIKTVLCDDFHRNDLEGDEVWNEYVPQKTRKKFLEEKREFAFAALDDLQRFFCEENVRENYYVLRRNDVAEWKMFFDKFFEEYENNLTQDNIIYNFTCDRKVHNNLSMKNIIYDTFTNRMVFINPTSRNLDIVDKNKDYASLYMCAMGLSAIDSKKFIEDCREITISKVAQERMNVCLDILNDLFDNSEYLMMYALYEMFLIAHKKKDAYLLKYISQLRTSLYFDMLTH